jgi:hypothetical protein
MLDDEFERLSEALAAWRYALDARRDFATKAYEALIERHAAASTAWFAAATTELYYLGWRHA